MDNNLNILNIDETIYETKFTKKYNLRKKYAPKNFKLVNAFIPGTIREIFVKENQMVTSGEKILILEAMKMKNIILAPISGRIKKINVTLNQSVAKNELLIELE